MGVGFVSVEPGPTIAWGARRKSGFPTAETQHNNTQFNDEDSHNQKSTLDIGQLIITHNKEAGCSHCETEKLSQRNRLEENYDTVRASCRAQKNCLHAGFRN